MNGKLMREVYFHTLIQEIDKARCFNCGGKMIYEFREPKVCGDCGGLSDSLPGHCARHCNGVGFEVIDLAVLEAEKNCHKHVPTTIDGIATKIEEHLSAYFKRAARHADN